MPQASRGVSTRHTESVRHKSKRPRIWRGGADRKAAGTGPTAAQACATGLQMLVTHDDRPNPNHGC